MRQFLGSPARVRVLLCAAVPALAAACAATPKPATTPSPASTARRPDTTQPDSAGADSARWSGLVWREIGPSRGGRSVAVAGSTKRRFEYWMGTTGGGVWKTT